MSGFVQTLAGVRRGGGGTGTREADEGHRLCRRATLADAAAGAVVTGLPRSLARDRPLPSRLLLPLPATTVSVLLLLLVAAQAPLPTSGEGLRPESELSSNCLNFPETAFTRDNCIMAINDGNSPYLPMKVGDDAIDFTLHDLDGERWNLGETLEATAMPVVMVWGMFTCPKFQGLDMESPLDQCSYEDEQTLVEEYKDRATFVHLYGPEPHPSAPGTNFDKGVNVQSFWSVVKQPLSYDHRKEMADRSKYMVHPKQALLVDSFPGSPYSDLIQPVWCSYLMGARGVTVVSPDGKIFFQLGWFHAEHTARAIDKYWVEQLADTGAMD